MQGKIKHLEFIQNTITRMAHNSFLLKGWAVTLVGALFALSSSSIDAGIVFIVIFLTAMFWILDAYYLSKEHLFRHHYDDVRLKEPDEIDFSMTLKLMNSSRTDLVVKLFSPTQLYFYGVLMVIVVLFDFYR